MRIVAEKIIYELPVHLLSRKKEGRQVTSRKRMRFLVSMVLQNYQL